MRIRHVKLINYFLKYHMIGGPYKVMASKMSSIPFQYLSNLLRASETKFVRIAWCDSANVICAKAASVPRLQSVYKDGIGLV